MWQGWGPRLLSLRSHPSRPPAPPQPPPHPLTDPAAPSPSHHRPFWPVPWAPAPPPALLPLGTDTPPSGSCVRWAMCGGRGSGRPSFQPPLDSAEEACCLRRGGAGGREGSRAPGPFRAEGCPLHCPTSPWKELGPLSKPHRPPSQAARGQARPCRDPARPWASTSPWPPSPR